VCQSASKVRPGGYRAARTASALSSFRNYALGKEMRARRRPRRTTELIGITVGNHRPRSRGPRAFDLFTAIRSGRFAAGFTTFTAVLIRDPPFEISASKRSVRARRIRRRSMPEAARAGTSTSSRCSEAQGASWRTSRRDGLSLRRVLQAPESTRLANLAKGAPSRASERF
jgi:hypothetical protein